MNLKPLVLLILAFAVPALAQERMPTNESESIRHFVSGAQLYQDYKSYTGEENFMDAAHYLGFITGVVDLGGGGLFCMPRNMTQGQLGGIVGKYLESNPQRLHFSGARLVIEAMQDHYPCEAE